MVTGGGRGVGRAVATALAAAGATVSAVSRTGLGDPEALPAGIEGHAVDLTKQDQLEALVRDVASRLGPVSILVHAAGVYANGPVASAPVADLDRQYDVNLRAPFVLTQLVLADLLQTEGDLVFINSATSGRAGVSQYAATKVGLRAIADALRDELNPGGVRVATIHLGRTATDMQRAIHEDEGRSWDATRLIQPDDVGTMVVQMVALPRTAQVSELWLVPLRRL